MSIDVEIYLPAGWAHLPPVTPKRGRMPSVPGQSVYLNAYPSRSLHPECQDWSHIDLSLCEQSGFFALRVRLTNAEDGKSAAVALPPREADVLARRLEYLLAPTTQSGEQWTAFGCSEIAFRPGCINRSMLQVTRCRTDGGDGITLQAYNTVTGSKVTLHLTEPQARELARALWSAPDEQGGA